MYKYTIVMCTSEIKLMQLGPRLLSLVPFIVSIARLSIIEVRAVVYTYLSQVQNMHVIIHLD